MFDVWNVLNLCRARVETALITHCYLCHEIVSTVSFSQVKTVSNACYGLCCWVHAIISYDKVAKVVAPKKQALAIAEAEVAGLMAILDQKRVSMNVSALAFFSGCRDVTFIQTIPLLFAINPVPLLVAHGPLPISVQKVINAIYSSTKPDHLASHDF